MLKCPDIASLLISKNPNYLYNCMGFALDIISNFYDLTDKIVDIMPYDYSDDDLELEEAIINFIGEYSQQLAPDRIRVINNENEVRNDEYLVYYRFDLNYHEYHFIRVYEDGVLEKNGDGPISHLPTDINFYNPWNWDEEEAELLLCSNIVGMLAVKPTSKTGGTSKSTLREFDNIKGFSN